MTSTTQCNTNSEHSTSVGTTIPYASVQDPGCYICNWSGHLLRVPEDGVAPGRSPLISIVGSDPLFLTKISDNPFITLTKAKMIAANIDCNVNF